MAALSHCTHAKPKQFALWTVWQAHFVRYYIGIKNDLPIQVLIVIDCKRTKHTKLLEQKGIKSGKENISESWYVSTVTKKNKKQEMYITLKSIHDIPLHLYSWDQFHLVGLSEVNKKEKKIVHLTFRTIQTVIPLCLFYSVYQFWGLTGRFERMSPTSEFPLRLVTTCWTEKNKEKPLLTNN